MHALTVLVVATLALAAYGLPSPRIVGGTDAPVGKYPYQVSLRINNKHLCGGSIINKRYILTAAHCIADLRSLSSLTVHAGTNYLNETGDVYKVKSAVSHEGWNDYLIVNDIGLLRLEKEIEYTDVVQPVEIATSNLVDAGHPCLVTGWGTTSFRGRTPNSLQQLDLLVEDQKKCQQAHWRVKDSHLCTFTKHGQGLCHGDSGGPLVADGVQIGIASFVTPCAVGYPDVYTRVSSFASWIEQHMQ